MQCRGLVVLLSERAMLRCAIFRSWLELKLDIIIEAKLVSPRMSSDCLLDGGCDTNLA